LSDLPKNFHGGDEALHFALGELFGQYGKIKKIELYMEKGILETENFKGEGLIVYHRTKQTGTHDKGDSVYDACTDLDGRVRVLGKRNWRIRCEPAEWQKDGYDVKEKAKLTPCIEIGNLWEYDPSLPMSWFMQMQEAIRQHAGEHISNPFVKVEPSQGLATVWCKGAQDAMKFAAMMQKSYFLGRKVTATLCRKERPAGENAQKLPTGELTMKVPAGMQVHPGTAVNLDGLLAAGIIPVSPQMPGAAGAKEPKQPKPQPKPQQAEEEPAVAMGPELPPELAARLAFTLEDGCPVVLKGLVSKPENNGRRGKVVNFSPDLQKYQVRLEDGRLVKLKPENLEAREPEPAEEPKAKKPRKASTAATGQHGAEDDVDSDAAEAEATAALDSAQAFAESMASGKVRHGPEMPDPNVDGFTATVCVDPALLPKREDPEAAAATQVKKRESSRSRERRQEERIAAAKARLEADKGPRPGWLVSGLPGAAAAQAAAGGSTAARREPEESREELLKMPVSKLKELLKEYGKTARGCCEKRDFVDRLKPAATA